MRVINFLHFLFDVNRRYIDVLNDTQRLLGLYLQVYKELQ